MTDSVRNPDDYCYRHPDRLSFVLCERCGRTICLECQTHVNGMVLCPDDAQRSNVTMINVNQRPPKPKRTRRLRGFAVPAALEGHPVVTYLFMAIGLVIFLADTISGQIIQPWLWVYPSNSTLHNLIFQPWALITSSFGTGGSPALLTLLLGGFSLFSLGRFVEQFLGRRRFITLFLGGGLGAAISSFVIGGYDINWFGAIFGLVAGAIIFARRLGVQPIFLYVTAAINLILAIFLGGWESVIGSLLAGAGIAFVYYFEDEPRRRNPIRLALIVVGAALLALGVVRAVATLVAS